MMVGSNAQELLPTHPTPIAYESVVGLYWQLSALLMSTWRHQGKTIEAWHKQQQQPPIHPLKSAYANCQS
jgi:hypothetical protein